MGLVLTWQWPLILLLLGKIVPDRMGELFGASKRYPEYDEDELLF